MDEIEQRKQQAAEAGHTSPWCASCYNMGNHNAKVCRDCQAATPMFTAAVRDFLTGVEGTKQ